MSADMNIFPNDVIFMSMKESAMKFMKRLFCEDVSWLEKIFVLRVKDPSVSPKLGILLQKGAFQLLAKSPLLNYQ